MLRDDAIEALSLTLANGAIGSLECAATSVGHFGRVARLHTAGGCDYETDIIASVKTAGSIAAGDVLLARFSMRCIDSMTGEGFATLIVEESGPPFEKSVEMRASAGKQWQQYSIPFRAPQNLPAGKAQLCFRVGFDRQTIELGGIELLNYHKIADIEALPKTQLTYAGREADAPWRAEALARIEKLRKGDLSIRVIDAAGKPVEGAQVRAKMIRHAFGFGCCVAAEELLGDAPDNRHYREIFGRLFNRAVFENDMKWPQTFDGIPSRLEKSMQWLEERHIAVRGHNLLWPSWRWLPAQLKQYASSPAQLRARSAARVTDMVTHFKGRLYQWDVVNELHTNHDLTDILGQDVLLDWYRLAKNADPHCKLYHNDYGIIDSGATDRQHQDGFYNEIKYLVDHHAPLDGIGIQSHFGMVLTPPMQMLHVLDRFSEFGLPIESTELSLNLHDRELQSDFMRDYMIAAFSHANVHGIMLWGFWEGRHWRPEAALYTRDWKIRPHGQTWIDLVHRQWKTDETQISDRSGAAKVRGFAGDYEITITHAGRTQTLSAVLPIDGTNLNVVMQ